VERRGEGDIESGLFPSDQRVRERGDSFEPHGIEMRPLVLIISSQLH
jgi:hypothetical protein